MFITNPLLTKLLPHMNHGSPSVTLTGIADTQSLNAFVESVSSFSSARAEHPFPDDPIKFRAQWSLVKTHHICGGVPLNFQNVEELLAWRKEGRFVVPEQFENTRNDERGALSSIRSQFTDPDICALHISLFNAGFLIQETRPSAERNIGQWHVRELVDLREGLEVVELLDAHTQGTAYDIMDLIASVDWGDFRPYGLKNINASLSSLSEFKNPHYRHSNGEEETTIITKKCHCVAHVFMGRLTVLWGKTQMLSFQTPPYRQPSAIKHIAAIQARLRYHSFARLAVEIAVANKLKASGLPHYAFIDDTSFDCMLNAIYHMGFDDMTQLSREDYIALHKKTFEALWTKTSISHEHTLTRIQDMLTLPLSGTAQSHAENTLDTIARKISEDIREMRSDRACIEGLLPQSPEPWTTLRLARFVFSLGLALTEISPRDAEETKTALALTQTLSTFTNDLLRRLEALSQWDLSQPDQELLSCLVSTQQLYLISPSKILQRLLSQQTTTNTSALAQQWGQLESLWTHKITSPLLS